MVLLNKIFNFGTNTLIVTNNKTKTIVKLKMKTRFVLSLICYIRVHKTVHELII